MTYLNPFALLPPDTLFSQVGPPLLRRTQRKLLADFELGDGVQIDIQGVTLDRSRVLGLLRELEDPNQRALHWWVWTDPGLLRTLTEPTQAHPDQLPGWSHLEENQRTFLSQTLREPFDQALSATLAENDYQQAAHWLAKAELFTGSDLEGAMTATLRYLIDEEERILKWSEDIRQMPRWQGELSRLTDPDYRDFLNQLPPRFQQYRNRIATALVELALAFANQKKSFYHARRITGHALGLDLDESTRYQVEHLHLQVDPQAKRVAGDNSPFQQEEESENKWGCSTTGIVIFVVIKVAILIIRAMMN